MICYTHEGMRMDGGDGTRVRWSGYCPLSYGVLDYTYVSYILVRVRK